VTPPANDYAKAGGIRINLLPPEILEKRKAESRRLVFLAVGLTVIALLGVAWAFVALFVGIKTGEVASKQQEAASLRAQAEAFKVFEDRGLELQARQEIADRALAGRISWSRIMGELSLVLPPDIWLSVFDGSEQTAATAGSSTTEGRPAPAATLSLTGWSLDQPAEEVNGGFKSIALLLVRLDDLEQLANVWLTSAEVKPGGYRGEDAIEFVSTSDVVGSRDASAAAANSGVPGKP
jgi:Tfp pilus assembly protein PilN